MQIREGWAQGGDRWERWSPCRGAVLQEAFRTSRVDVAAGVLTREPPVSLVEGAAGAGLEDNSSFMGGKF